MGSFYWFIVATPELDNFIDRQLTLLEIRNEVVSNDDQT
jgi:hypothetical protein